VINTKVIILLTAFAIPLAQTTAVSRSDQRDRTDQVETISFCELLSQAKIHEGKTVRLRALYSRLISLESILSGANCKSEGAVAVGYNDQSNSALTNKIDDVLNSWNVDQVEVTVVGTLMPPVSSDSRYNYGHMGRYKYQFAISRIDKIERVRSTR